MCVVEPNLLDDDADQEVPDGGGEGGQLVATPAAPPEDKGVSAQSADQVHHGYVEGYEPHGLLVLLPVYLCVCERQS